MALTAQRVQATPYLLKYLITAASTSTNSPTVDTQLTIPNKGGVTPDLRTDALFGSATFAGTRSPLLAIMRAFQDGYGPVAKGVALSQAQARALLCTDDNGNAVLTNPLIISAEMFITRRQVPGSGGTTVAVQPPSWSCDANVDASGFPVVNVRISNRAVTTGQTAYLTIRCRHSIDL